MPVGGDPIFDGADAMDGTDVTVLAGSRTTIGAQVSLSAAVDPAP